VKTRLPAGLALLALLLLAGFGLRYGSKALDHILVALILGLYGIGSVVLVLRSLLSRPEDRRRLFSCGELALLPEKWRRWVLDEKEDSRDAA